MQRWQAGGGCGPDRETRFTSSGHPDAGIGRIPGTRHNPGRPDADCYLHHRIRSVRNTSIRRACARLSSQALQSGAIAPLDPEGQDGTPEIARTDCKRAPPQSVKHDQGWVWTLRRLVIRTSGRVVFLDLNEIDWIEAAANYVKLHCGKDSYLLREGIGHLASKLDPERFVRIHRSSIVNVSRIRELQPCESGEYIAVLKNGKELSCSRGCRPQLLRFIAGNV